MGQKGFEDTTFYVYNRLLSPNNVGGNPAALNVSGRASSIQIGQRRDRCSTP